MKKFVWKEYANDQELTTNLQFYITYSFKMNRTKKKFTKKLKSSTNLHKKYLIIYKRLIGLWTKFYERLPLKFALGSFYLEILSILFGLGTISKKIQPRGYFWIFASGPPTWPKFKTHKKFVRTTFIYIFMYICV